jgi:hypothetical protein
VCANEDTARDGYDLMNACMSLLFKALSICLMGLVGFGGVLSILLGVNVSDLAPKLIFWFIGLCLLLPAIAGISAVIRSPKVLDDNKPKR